MKTITLGAVAVLATLLTGPAPAADVQPGASRPVTVGDKDPKPAAEAVTRALRASAEIPAEDISVSIHGAAVMLGGTVDNDAQAARALTVAETAAAGVRVVSNLEVKLPDAGATPSPSAQLVQEVESALKNDPRTADLGISVSINEQQAIGLHGLVPTAEDRATARSVALRVKGVKQVENQLAIAGR